MNVCIIDSSDGGLYLDENHYQPLPSHIGPFTSEREAQRYLDEIRPLWGSYSITPLSPAVYRSTSTNHTDGS